MNVSKCHAVSGTVADSRLKINPQGFFKQNLTDPMEKRKSDGEDFAITITVTVLSGS